MALTKEFLLQKLWESCTFDEILNAGFEKDKIGISDIFNKAWEYGTFNDILDVGIDNELVSGEDIINAAAEYSDPNKEFSDDEIIEIVKDADISIVIDALEDKYTMYEIINEFDKEEILNSFDFDDIYDHFEWDYKDKLEEEYNSGYEKGLSDGKKEGSIDSITEKDLINHLKECNINDLWCFFANLFDISYYDDNGMYHKLNNMIRNFNKSMYKNKKEHQWLNINLEQ